MARLIAVPQIAGAEKLWHDLTESTRICVAVLALLSTAACSAGESAPGSDATESPNAPPASTRTVVVTLVDKAPLNLLSEYDERRCSTDAAVERGSDILVSLRDAEDTVLGSAVLPYLGGAKDERGCTWPVTFKDVPDVELYKVVVRSGDFERSASARPGAGDLRIVVAF